jgi:hypothetical protein
MDAEQFVKLIEELVDLKIQRLTQANIKISPELVPVLQSKRESDRRRLEQIRVELVRHLKQ